MPAWLFLALLVLSAPGHAASWREHPSWRSSFAQAGVKGTLRVYNEKADVWHVSDAARARRAFLPASTFKLFNALVALDSGAVRDEFDVNRWGGEVRGLKDVAWPTTGCRSRRVRRKIVRRISITESAPTCVLHAKTGWGTRAAQNSANDDLGWYVGWVEHAGRRWFFAMNIDLPGPGDAAKRVPLAKRLLAQLGALPPGS